MESLYLLIPLSIGVVFVAIWIFFMASDGGQFDDLVGPGLRVLQDDDSGRDDVAARSPALQAAASVAPDPANITVKHLPDHL